MKCRDAALQAAEKDNREKYKKMSLADAVQVGYSLLAPKLDDDMAADFDKWFWKRALEPVKQAEGSWMKILFPAPDPNLNPNRPGAAPIVKELSSPLGEIGDPDKPPPEGPQDGEEHPDFRHWKCYFLSKKCRKQAKHR